MPTKNPREITSEELKAKMDAGEEILLIDLLGPRSHESLHVPGSVPVDGRATDRTDAIRDLAEGDFERTIVVYGLNFKDPLSTDVAAELMDEGFTDVFDYKGGLKDWSAELYPLGGKRAPSAS